MKKLTLSFMIFLGMLQASEQPLLSTNDKVCRIGTCYHQLQQDERRLFTHYENGTYKAWYLGATSEELVRPAIAKQLFLKLKKLYAQKPAVDTTERKMQ